MSPRTARCIVAVGVFSYGVMWVFLFLSVAAWRDALAHAEAAIHGDISGVSAALRRALETARIGGSLGLFGCVLIFVGVKQGGARARWIYRSGLAVSISSLLLFPLGTIMGVRGLIHFRRFKHEYLTAGRQAVVVPTRGNGT